MLLAVGGNFKEVMPGPGGVGEALHELDDDVQDLVHRVAAGVLTIDLVVAGHDRAGLRVLNRDLEGMQIRLAMRVGIDNCI